MRQSKRAWRRMQWAMCLCSGGLVPLPLATVGAGQNLVANGGFEEIGPGPETPAASWTGFWSRDEGQGQAALDETVKHAGRASLRVVHTGTRDWSVSQAERIGVSPGDILRLSGWVKCEGVEASVTLSVIPYDESGKVITWFWGGVSTKGTHGFKLLQSRFALPANCSEVVVRFTGAGPGTAWLDDVVLTRKGNLNEISSLSPSAELTLRNGALEITFNPRTGVLTVRDARAGALWKPHLLRPGLIIKKVSRRQ